MSSCKKLASAGPAGPVARKSKPANSCSGSGSAVATPAATPSGTSSGSGIAAPSVVSTKVAKAKLPRKNRVDKESKKSKTGEDLLTKKEKQGKPFSKVLL